MEMIGGRQGTTTNSVSQRVTSSLRAGTIAIALNVAVLWSADLIHLPTAHGGLLKLLVQLTGLPLPRGGVFKIGFHVAVGLAIANVYGVFLEPLWRGPAWVLGLTYATIVWIVNAFVILPLIGEGIAGSATLSTAGILWFAVAHTIFFISLSLVYPLHNPVRRQGLRDG